jgi:hypothetical protein
MEFLTKEFISRLILEEVQGYELSEMALNAMWAPSELPQQMTFNVDSIGNIPVNAIDVKAKIFIGLTASKVTLGEINKVTKTNAPVINFSSIQFKSLCMKPRVLTRPPFSRDLSIMPSHDI